MVEYKQWIPINDDSRTYSSDNETLYNGSTIVAANHDDTIGYNVSLAGIFQSYNVADSVKSADGVIDLAEGDDSVTLLSVKNSTSHISLRGGNDTLFFTESSKAYPLRNAEVDLGEGNDSLYIRNSNNYGVVSDSTVRAGAGNDTLWFAGGVDHNGGGDVCLDLGTGADVVSVGGWMKHTSLTAGNGDTVGDSISVGDITEFSQFTLGDGANRLEFLGVNGERKSADGVTITGGSGDDTLYFQNWILCSAKDERNVIDLGAGADSFYVGGVAQKISLTAGDGDDSLTFQGGLDAPSVGNIVDLGEGDNHLTVGAQSPYYRCLNMTSVKGGGGKDFVSLQGGLCDSGISLGGGADSIVVASLEGASALGWLGETTFNLGDDDDFVSIQGDISHWVDIWGGAGDDSVIIDGSVKAYHGTEDTLHVPWVMLGDGDDYLRLSSVAEDGTNIRVNPGAGADSISLHRPEDIKKLIITDSRSGDSNRTLTADDCIILDEGMEDMMQHLLMDEQGFLYYDNVKTGVQVSPDEQGEYGINVQSGTTGERTMLRPDGYVDPTPPSPTTPGGDTLPAGYWNSDGVYVITGVEGADNNIDITGLDSVVIVSLSGGNDSVTAAGRGDTILTGGGSDSVVVSGTSGGTIDLASGDDTLYLAADNGTVNLGGGSDRATVGGNNAKVDLGEGSDAMELMGLHATVTAGTGDDTIRVNGGSAATLYLGEGSDSLYSRGNCETIYAGTGDDTLIFDGTGGATGSDGFHYIDLVEDNNLVSMRGGDGHTTIAGGVSADSLYFTGGDVERDVLDLAAGNDYVFFDSQAGQSFGGNIARANNTTLRAGIGDDSVYAWSAEQAIMDGGTGDDSINIVNARYTTIVSGSGDDSIVLGTDVSGNNATDNSTGYNVVNLRGDGTGSGHNIVTI
ncbi:MAG: calcium-binding protein, partial [Schwartzia sp.]|nr:calcium-binding protein [Schwartzia sp. (in: firmicutes)]